MWKACHYSWHCLLDPHLAQISKRAILFCLTPRLAGLSAVVVSQLSTATQHCLGYASPSLKTLWGSSWLWITQFNSCHNSSLEAACFLHSWFSSAEMQGIALMVEVADFKPRNISKPKNKASTLGNIRTLQELPKWIWTSHSWTSRISGWYWGISDTNLCEPYWACTFCHILF